MRYRQRFDRLAYQENTCTISMSSSPLVASSRSILSCVACVMVLGLAANIYNGALPVLWPDTAGGQGGVRYRAQEKRGHSAMDGTSWRNVVSDSNLGITIPVVITLHLLRA